jgi:hypothetical protein
VARGVVLGPPNVAGRALPLLAFLTFVVGLVTGVTLTVAGPSAAPSCSSYATCLTSPSNLASEFHLYSAGLLLSISLLVLVLSILARPTTPSIPKVAAFAFFALLGMAAMGGLLATGVVPRSEAPLQYLLLGIFLALNLYLAFGTPTSRWCRTDHDGPGGLAPTT